MNLHRRSGINRQKPAGIVCLLFMVGACKVYSVIDGNDLSHRKPADNPSLCTEATYTLKHKYVPRSAQVCSISK